MLASPGRRVSAGIRTAIRGLSTEGVVEVELAQPAARERGKENRLYRRLSALGATKGTVAKTINEYIREGRYARKYDLDRCIQELRKYKRHDHALEIMEWMELRQLNFGLRDYAVQLDLIGKVKGITAAEAYFNELPPSAKNKLTYGALFNCYCVEKMTDKALDLFDKMDELNMCTSLTFNNLMSLYMRLGQPEKVPPLREGMNRRNIKPSTFTYNILMNSYSSLNDIEGAERVFEELKQENGEACDWTTYSNLAVLYIRAGLLEKAESALAKLEEVAGSHNREAYHFLLSLNSTISKLEEVHRIWGCMKSKFKTVTNISCLVMLQALSKLNDIEGLKSCYKEWESICSSYDMRLANTVIGSYLTNNMISEAESVFRTAINRSHGPFFKASEMFMIHHLNNHQIEKALDFMEVAISKLTENNWRPKADTLSKFFNYFKEEADVDSAEKFYKFMRKMGYLNHTVYRNLLETYIAARRTAPDMHAKMEADGILVSGDLIPLLERVCGE